MSVSVGGQLSLFSPDWGCSRNFPLLCANHQILGIGAYVDANYLIRNLGVEGESRWLRWRGPGDGFVQSNYLIGPKYRLWGRGKSTLFAKTLVGGSWITLPSDRGHGSYFTVTPGMTLEYLLSRKLSFRADYEYQFWPAFSGISTS